MTATADRLYAEARAAILALLAARGADKTICPSEAARAIGGEAWREAMPVVHEAARALAEAGMVELRQGGARREPGAVVGAYRIAQSKPGPTFALAPSVLWE